MKGLVHSKLGYGPYQSWILQDFFCKIDFLGLFSIPLIDNLRGKEFIAKAFKEVEWWFLVPTEFSPMDFMLGFGQIDWLWH